MAKQKKENPQFLISTKGSGVEMIFSSKNSKHPLLPATFDHTDAALDCIRIIRKLKTAKDVRVCLDQDDDNKLYFEVYNQIGITLCRSRGYENKQNLMKCFAAFVRDARVARIFENQRKELFLD